MGALVWIANPIADSFNIILGELLFIRFNILLFETLLNTTGFSHDEDIKRELGNSKGLQLEKLDELKKKIVEANEKGDHYWGNLNIDNLAGNYIRHKLLIDPKPTSIVDFYQESERHMNHSKCRIANAAEKILLTCDMPMHYTEIFEKAIQQNLLTSTDQAKDIYRTLLVQSSKPITGSRFQRVGAGIFALAPSRKQISIPQNALESYMFCIPESSYGTFEIGNKIQVPRDWEALLIANDKVLMKYPPGIHIIDSGAIPSDADGKIIAQLCFINCGAWLVKWGTVQPIQLLDIDLEIAEIQGYGSYLVIVEDSERFILGSVRIGLGHIEELLREFAVDRFINYLQLHYSGTKSELEEVNKEIGSLLDHYNFLLYPLGLRATHSTIGSISFTRNTLEQIRSRSDSQRLLVKMDSKLNMLIKSMEQTHIEVAKVRGDILFELKKLSDQVQVSFIEVLNKLKSTSSEEVMTIYSMLEQGKVSDDQAEYVLLELREVLGEIRKRELKLPSNVSIDPLAELVDAPKLDVAHKLKFTLPLIPFILDYEAEIQLGSVLNLEAAWTWLISKAKRHS